MIIRPEAEKDIAEAINWYEDQREGLGAKFQVALDHVFEQLELTPQLHRIIYHGVRRALMARFPFAVYYRVEGEEVFVLAVVHARRDPERWKSRI